MLVVGLILGLCLGYILGCWILRDFGRQARAVAGELSPKVGSKQAPCGEGEPVEEFPAARARARLLRG